MEKLKLGAIVLGTSLGAALFTAIGLNRESILLFFMIGVLLVTTASQGYLPGLIVSIFFSMIFNYFYTEPYHTFSISDRNDIVLFLFFLIASLITSTLTTKFQKQTIIAKKNAETIQMLFDISQLFRGGTSQDDILSTSSEIIYKYTGFQSRIELNTDDLAHDQMSEENNYGGEVEQLFKIPGRKTTLGTIRVQTGFEEANRTQILVIEAVASQMAIALEREFMYQEREKYKLDMEKERLQRLAMQSVSHDLRTPLTGIVGACNYILDQKDGIINSQIISMIQDINEQALWLSELVENSLHLISIENGSLVIKKNLEVVEDVVYEAVRHVDGLKERALTIDMPKEMMIAPMDGKRIVQVLVNLLGNAVRYSQKESPIRLTVEREEEQLLFNVSDAGPGIDASTSLGLGLTICQAFIHAHGGVFKIENHSQGGVSASFTLPLGEVSNESNA
jgi:two-component system sensor histidine kinase KdpD